MLLPYVMEYPFFTKGFRYGFATQFLDKFIRELYLHLIEYQ